ncbi:MAG TPA: hypothetical protein VJ984_15840 [Xanthomonadales bacterium]|nr:hypothetical protein [Xanthomonadales bacterium]
MKTSNTEDTKMENATRPFALIFALMALALLNNPVSAQDIVIDSGTDDTVIPRLTAAPAQEQLVCSDPADGTLGPCAGSNREPVALRISARESNFGGFLTLFIDNAYSICIGTTPVCEAESARYVVPPGKSLLVREISIQARALVGAAPSTAAGQLTFRTPDATGFEYFLGVLDFTDPGLKIWKEGRPATIIVPAGSEVFGRIDWSQSGPTEVEGTLFLSGELVSDNP